MNHRFVIRIVIGLILALGLGACLEDKDDVAGVSVVENEIIGRILADEDIPASGIRVDLFQAESAGKPIDSTVTAADGSYRFQSLKPGTYSTLARRNAESAFDDAIGVLSGPVNRGAKALRPGGSVRTVVALRPGDDISTVTAVILGSDFASKPGPDGDMGMDNMPEGTLRILISTSLPGYLPLEAKLIIISGKETQIDTLHLPQAR